MSNPISIGGFQAGRRWLMFIAVLLIGSMVLAACGGDDDEDETPTAPAATEAVTETEETTEAEETATTAAVASPAASPMASPIASPVASPMASPVAAASPVMGASPVASPAASPAASPMASPGASPAASAESVTVTSLDIRFEPSEVTIPANTDVAFTLPNEGAAPHNFSIDALDISVDQAPGETKEITINAPAGEYEYYCDVPGHKEAGMVGTLIVE